MVVARVVHMFEDVVATRDRLAELVDRLDPDRCTGPAARELWRVFDSAERLCAAGKTLLARRLAETHQRTSGTRSAAEELARTAGTSTGQPRTRCAPRSGCRTNAGWSRRCAVASCPRRRLR